MAHAQSAAKPMKDKAADERRHRELLICIVAAGYAATNRPISPHTIVDLARNIVDEAQRLEQADEC